jgi:hypothetical protein
MIQNMEIQKNRNSQLKREIEKSFDHLAPDEIDILASDYERSETRMIEVIKIRKKSVLIMDLKKDIEFSHVIFPTSILQLLERHDAFLATFGLRNKKWEIIYLSPPYNEFNIKT